MGARGSTEAPAEASRYVRTVVTCCALPCPALPAGQGRAGQGTALPGLACPGLCTSSSPDRGREGQVVCDPQPDTHPYQQCLVVQCGCLCVERGQEAESKKAPLEGGLGGEP